jgi:hypothetical protein
MSNEKVVFIKSWNEWAEGNYLEPDQEFGLQYLKVIREEVQLDHRKGLPNESFSSYSHI